VPAREEQTGTQGKKTMNLKRGTHSVEGGSKKQGIKKGRARKENAMESIPKENGGSATESKKLKISPRKTDLLA